MTGQGSVEYAWARLAARQGTRPDNALWHRLETVRSFAALLDVARRTAAEPWLAGLTPESDVHQVEAVLRGRWRAHVAEVASWLPDAWQPAVRWCSYAPDLPVLGHLARGLAPLPWMARDPLYRQLGAQAPTVPLLPLAAAWSTPAALPAAWLAHWHRLLPSRDPERAGPLPDLERTLARHLAAFRSTDAADGTPLRQALRARLQTLFRRAVVTPAAAFIHLAGTALDLERLRGELVRRCAFPHAAFPA